MPNPSDYDAVHTNSARKTPVGEIALIIGLLALLVLPFAGKPFHIDDPFYLQVAQQIVEQPLNPYGFDYNWFGTAAPVHAIVHNPPLVAYYIALTTTLFGESEIALHLAFFLMTLLAGAGTYRLAARLSRSPLLATLAAVLAPVFLLSSTTLMLDMPMLAAYLWAMVLWIEGLDRTQPMRLLASAAIICLAVVTKYIALTLVPLLIAYTLVRRASWRQWLVPICLPLLFTVGYALWYESLYGSSPFFSASSFSLAVKYSDFSPLNALLIGLGFLGGGLVGTLLLTPWLWSLRGMLAWLLYLAGASLLIWSGRAELATAQSGMGLGQTIELALYVTAGSQLLTLALLDVWQNRSANALLLALWLLGIFIFASLLSWSVNGRTILMVAAAGGILIARRLEYRRGLPLNWRPLLLPLLLSAILGTLLNLADYRLAASARDAAMIIRQKIPEQVVNVWFFGHWGFQHYMEQQGAKAIDSRSTGIRPGDAVVIPDNNSNVNVPQAWRPHLRLVEELQLPGFAYASTLHMQNNAGFYSSVFGPLPFSFTKAPDEKYWLLTVVP